MRLPVVLSISLDCIRLEKHDFRQKFSAIPVYTNRRTQVFEVLKISKNKSTSCTLGSVVFVWVFGRFEISVCRSHLVFTIAKQHRSTPIHLLSSISISSIYPVKFKHEMYMCIKKTFVSTLKSITTNVDSFRYLNI